MKYYSELMELESKIIEMELALAGFRGFVNGATQLDLECLQNALYFFDESLHNIHEASNSSFRDLWSTVRDDVDPGLKVVGGMEKKRMVTDKTLD